MLGIQVVFAFPAMALATLFVTLPYTMREVIYVLEEIGTSEEEAARTLGASPSRTFFTVTLPNLRHAISYGVLMTTARALGEFGAVLILGGSIAGVTQTATTLVHDALEERMELTAYAVATILAAAGLVLLALLEWARKKETAS
jgi:sulfate transport system permease protein